jgi:hypothetical protein
LDSLLIDTHQDAFEACFDFGTRDDEGWLLFPILEERAGDHETARITRFVISSGRSATTVAPRTDAAR